MNIRPNRREFVETMSVTTAGLMAAGYTATARGFAANDTINVGCIGTGGRCRQLMKALSKIAGVRIAGVCDVWDTNLAEGRKLADPQAFATKDHRALLDRKDIDAVVIGTPDGEVLHLTNWLECVRSRKSPHCPASVGAIAANAAHLANRALRSGQVVRGATAS